MAGYAGGIGKPSCDGLRWLREGRESEEKKDGEFHVLPLHYDDGHSARSRDAEHGPVERELTGVIVKSSKRDGRKGKRDCGDGRVVRVDIRVAALNQDRRCRRARKDDLEDHRGGVSAGSKAARERDGLEPSGGRFGSAEQFVAISGNDACEHAARLWLIVNHTNLSEMEYRESTMFLLLVALAAVMILLSIVEALDARADWQDPETFRGE